MQAAQTSTTQAIDVSRYQGTIDWKRMKAADKSFAFIKSSDSCK